MKFILVFMVLLSSALFAQDNAGKALGAPGCGPANQKFEVKTDSGQHPVTQPEPGKAVIYVIQDDRYFESHPRPTTRVGVDGSWVGAMRSNSYLQTSIEPGEHHLCASWQSFVGIGMGMKVAALHFTAESAESYYFVVKDKWLRDHGPGDIKFEALDSDEGQLLASKSAFSTSYPKK
jgi:hypothetical protein